MVWCQGGTCFQGPVLLGGAFDSCCPGLKLAGATAAALEGATWGRFLGADALDAAVPSKGPGPCPDEAALPPEGGAPEALRSKRLS